MSKKKRVAYLGKSKVTFSYQAAQKLGRNCEFKGYPTHAEVYKAVKNGDADLGLLAIENQISGVVDESMHAVIDPILAQEKPSQENPLGESDNYVRIVREVAVPVALFAMNQSGDPKDIKKVMTHAAPMRQSHGWLERLKDGQNFEKETCSSTERAAQLANEDPSIAAISSELAPTEYKNLKIIGRTDDPIRNDLDEDYENATRFWVIERGSSPTSVNFGSKRNKVCLLFNLNRDEAGGLAKSLAVFSDAGINLAMIYSLPRRDKRWEYTFVLEFEAAVDSETALEIEQTWKAKLTDSLGQALGKALEPALTKALKKALEHALEELKTKADYTVLGVFPSSRPASQ